MKSLVVRKDLDKVKKKKNYLSKGHLINLLNINTC
jgi:hypothetical protein